MKQNFTFLLFLLTTIVVGQKKVNDSIGLAQQNKYYSLRLVKLQLPELLKTKENFYFRLSYHGTKIDIWKDSTNTINGILTKFIFSEELKTKKKDTIFVKYPIKKANEVYNLINESKILDIPSEKEIKNWSNGFDGITYTFEFANKHNYQIKSYWSPKAQDSTITEAKQLVNFCEKIEYLANNDSIKEQFIGALKPGFHYKNGGSTTMFIMPKSTININYTGNYRLPIGLSIGYYARNINKKKINFGTFLTFQNNLNNNTHFESTFYTWKIFGNNKTYFDSFRLVYENNKLDYMKFLPKYENYIINYSGNFNKYISFGFGYNQLKADKTYNGFRFGVSKEFESIHLDLYLDIAVFENNMTNYIIGIQKLFKIKTEHKIFRIYTNLFHEKTFDFKSLNFSLSIPIKDWTIN